MHTRCLTHAHVRTVDDARHRPHEAAVQVKRRGVREHFGRRRRGGRGRDAAHHSRSWPSERPRRLRARRSSRGVCAAETATPQRGQRCSTRARSTHGSHISSDIVGELPERRPAARRASARRAAPALTRAPRRSGPRSCGCRVLLWPGRAGRRHVEAARSTRGGCPEVGNRPRRWSSSRGARGSLRSKGRTRKERESPKLPRATLGTGLARTGTNTGTPREPPKRLLRGWRGT